jgi:hypothetical protein
MAVGSLEPGVDVESSLHVVLARRDVLDGLERVADDRVIRARQDDLAAAREVTHILPPEGDTTGPGLEARFAPLVGGNDDEDASDHRYVEPQLGDGRGRPRAELDLEA